MFCLFVVNPFVAPGLVLAERCTHTPANNIFWFTFNNVCFDLKKILAHALAKKEKKRGNERA